MLGLFQLLYCMWLVVGRQYSDVVLRQLLAAAQQVLKVAGRVLDVKVLAAT